MESNETGSAAKPEDAAKVVSGEGGSTVRKTTGGASSVDDAQASGLLGGPLKAGEPGATAPPPPEASRESTPSKPGVAGEGPTAEQKAEQEAAEKKAADDKAAAKAGAKEAAKAKREQAAAEKKAKNDAEPKEASKGAVKISEDLSFEGNRATLWRMAEKGTTFEKMRDATGSISSVETLHIMAGLAGREIEVSKAKGVKTYKLGGKVKAAE